MYQVYSRTKKAPDFIGRNRRAVRECEKGGKGGVGKGKENLETEKKGGRVRGEGGAETVVVSKSYLDQLLRMSVTAAPQNVATETSHHTPSLPPHAPRLHNTITMATHIQPDPSQVPGLPPLSSVPEPSLRKHPAPASGETFSPREQWLADLNQQRREQAVRRREEEEERRRGQEARDVGYFPWGRPGGGAPIRTNSGKLLTDYASRGHVIEEMRSSTQSGATWQQDTGRQHTWQQDTGRQHTWQQDTGRQHTWQQDTGRQHTWQQDTGRQHTWQQDTGRQHTWQQDTGRQHTWQQDTGRQHTWQHGTGQDPQHGVTPQAVSPRYPTSPHKPHSTALNPHSTAHKPQFARGVGPHVDSFILEQREERRRKELSHKEELAAQIAENKRRKEEEKRKKELEEREEEERIWKERDGIRRREEEERERKRLKEEEEKAWAAMLQSRIEEAEESARKAKEAQRQKAGHPAHLQRSGPTLHSPSLLTLDHRQYESGQEGYLQNRAAAPSSRIPLPSKTSTRAVGVGEGRRRGGDRGGVEGVRRRVGGVEEVRRGGGGGRSVERGGRNTPGRRPHPLSNSGHMSHAIHVPVVRGVRERTYHPHHPPHHPPHHSQFPPSPPVPILSRRFADGHQLRTTAAAQPLPPSPPVPALAKKLAAHTQTLPALLSPATHLHQDSTQPVARAPSPPHPHMGTMSQPRTSSPPVPALAKRLQAVHSNAPPLPSSSPHPPPPSPPIPALARGLKDATRQSPPLTIHRPPSCHPSHSPPPTLPSIPNPQQPTITSTTFPQHTLPAARQQTILHQLAILREGILSQRSSLDHRVQQILCNKTLAHL